MDDLVNLSLVVGTLLVDVQPRNILYVVMKNHASSIYWSREVG